MSLSELILNTQEKIIMIDEELNSLNEEMINIVAIPNDDDKRKHKEKCLKEIQSKIEFKRGNKVYILIKLHALNIALKEEELEQNYILIKNMESEVLDETEPEDILIQKRNHYGDLHGEYNRNRNISRNHIQTILMIEYPERYNVQEQNNDQEQIHEPNY